MSEQSGKPEPQGTPFSAQDAMAFMQRMWNPFAMPMPGSASGAVMPTDTPEPAAASADDSATQSQGSGSAVHDMMGTMMPGMLPFPNPAAMFAALNPVEIERKIGELRIIEGWLAMSLNVMQMSIKTLELQLASLEALHAAHAPTRGRSDPKGKKG